MRTFLITLSAIGLSYATPSCHELHKTQLTSLSERMNQMLSSLYTSPLASKAESNTTPPSKPSTVSASDYASLPYGPFYSYPPYSLPVPPIVYVSPSHFPTPPHAFIPPTLSPLPITPPFPIDADIGSLKSPYYPYKEMVPPFDFGYPRPPIDTSPPWAATYYEHHPYTQYPLPHYPPIPLQQPYPTPYPYPEYPVYPKTGLYPLTPTYPTPPHVYPPPPTHYPLSSLYHKSSEMPPPPYYF